MPVKTVGAEQRRVPNNCRTPVVTDMTAGHYARAIQNTDHSSARIREAKLLSG